MPNTKQPIFEVIVGNIGTVYSGNNYMQAVSKYSAYVKLALSITGRASGESVVLMKHGDILREHEAATV